MFRAISMRSRAAIAPGNDPEIATTRKTAKTLPETPFFERLAAALGKRWS
jgi:hypothetical protein